MYSYEVTELTKGVSIVVSDVQSGKTKEFTLVIPSAATAEKFMHSLTDVQLKDIMKSA